MRLKELYEQYRDRVEFIVVYVKEAHASDRWWLGRSRTQRLVNEWSGNLARTDPNHLQPVIEAYLSRA